MKLFRSASKKALAGQENAEPVRKKLLQEVQKGVDNLKTSKVKELVKINQFLNSVKEEV